MLMIEFVCYSAHTFQLCDLYILFLLSVTQAIGVECTNWDMYDTYDAIEKEQKGENCYFLEVEVSETNILFYRILV